MPLPVREDEGLGGVLQVPHPRRVILAARRKTPVGAEGEDVNHGSVSWEEDGLVHGVLQVPHPHRAVPTPRSELTVGRESQRQNRAPVLQDGTTLDPRHRILERLLRGRYQGLLAISRGADCLHGEQETSLGLLRFCLQG